PLHAYTYDIVGSLLGILVFSLQCLAATGPHTWVMTGGLLLIVAYLVSHDENARASAVYTFMATVCVLILLSSAQSGVYTIWSAYQKLEVIKNREEVPAAIYANGILHQLMHPSASVKQFYYGYPYRLMQESGLHHDRVLVIGAGSGTDVAVALQYGAREVDAVEIDSRIVDIGKKLHPDQPYADNRVKLYVADGRQFLETTDKRYDLVVFALPDSLMRLSAMNSVRLESFLFTREAFTSVKNRLSEHGVFVMYNQYRWPWLVNKIATALDEIFGKPPRIYTEGATTVFAIGGDIGSDAYSKDGFKGLPTDDWPFVYMQEPGVHWLYIGMIGVFLLVSIIGVYFFAPSGTLGRPEYPFFFMGMAFLLLETKSLSFFSLLFGTTWAVNTVAFSGILLSVLMANFVVQRTGISMRAPLFIGLLVCLLAAYAMPPAWFLKIESSVLRYCFGILIMFLPVFFANLIFSREFRDVEESTRAFGWNLLGAVAGGGLEYLSLVVGFRNLLWVVAFCYLCTA
ncbi:MAG: spermidine synthase, partial [Gammaproteobacteria bacterium]